MINVMLVGGGAREDAICRKLVEDGAVIHAALSNLNPSIVSMAENIFVVKETDSEALLRYAVRNQADLVFVSPDSALETDLVDRLLERGIRVASPSRRAARIETSKAFMRELVDRHRIPGQISNRVFESPEGLEKYFHDLGGEYVIKPIGLTGGKGVKVKGDHFASDEEGLKIADSLIKKDGHVLIERKVYGQEFSLQAFCDGSSLFFMPVAQDYKRALEGDLGPNTGGMGSITSSDHGLPFLTSESVEMAKETMRQVASSLRKEGSDFHGVLYGQFMFTGSETLIIEVNARFADPEGINAIFLMQGSLLETLFGIADGSIRNRISFESKSTVLKYVVPPGYGTAPKVVDLTVQVDKFRSNPCLYYASVSGSMAKVKTTSSRALAVIASADKIWEASRKIENSLEWISGNYYHRRDIGARESIAAKMKSTRIRAS